MTLDFGPLPETAYKFRALKLAKPQQVGWDVYALQTALAGLKGTGDKPVADGVFGERTEDAVIAFQQTRDLAPADGIAGPMTQAKIAQVLGRKFREGWDLPNGLPYGSMVKESSLWLGNYSSMRSDGNRDCGVCQRNTALTPMAKGFDVPDSLMALCERIRNYHDKFQKLGTLTDRRCWELGCGAWNAPAYANWLGGLRDSSALKPSEASVAALEDYMSDCTEYLQL